MKSLSIWENGITKKEANDAIFYEDMKTRGYDGNRVTRMNAVNSKIYHFTDNATLTAPHASAGVLFLARYNVKQNRKVA
jgi:hypothetical protein